MFKGSMNKLLLIFLILTCIIIPARAENISDIQIRQNEDGIYNLVYTRLQIQAVDNDMILYFGWMPEDKEGMKQTAQQSIQELDRLRTNLMSYGMPLELADVKNEMMGLLEKQKDIYRGVETKNKEQIHNSYQEFQKKIDTLTEHIYQKIDQYSKVEKIPDDFSEINEELKLFSDSKDRALFKQATDLMNNMNFNESYWILADLKEKYLNTPIEGSIKIKMSDCILTFDSGLPEDIQMSSIGYELLDQILSKKVYYPVLYEAFHRWRTKEQELNHGMSNFSEIPNLEYNDKRMEVVRVIQQYLLAHPDDNWAKIQIIQLLTLENIVRGDVMGNSNLRHMAVLYMNLDKEQDPYPEPSQETQEQMDNLKKLEDPLGE